MSAPDVAYVDPALAESADSGDCFTSPLWSAVSAGDSPAAASLVSAGARLHSLEWGSLVEEGNVDALTTALKAGGRPSAEDMGSLLIDSARFNPQGVFQPAAAMALTDALLAGAQEAGAAYCTEVVHAGGRQAMTCSAEAAGDDSPEVVQRSTDFVHTYG